MEIEVGDGGCVLSGYGFYLVLRLDVNWLYYGFEWVVVFVGKDRGRENLCFDCGWRIKLFFWCYFIYFLCEWRVVCF